MRAKKTNSDQKKSVFWGMDFILILQLVLHFCIILTSITLKNKIHEYQFKIHKLEDKISLLSSNIDKFKPHHLDTTSIQKKDIHNNPPSIYVINHKKDSDITVEKRNKPLLSKSKNYLNAPNGIYAAATNEPIYFSKTHSIQNLKISINIKNKNIDTAILNFDFIDNHYDTQKKVKFKIGSVLINQNNIEIKFIDLFKPPVNESVFSMLDNSTERTVIFNGEFKNNIIEGKLSWRELSDDKSNFIPLKINTSLTSK